jgi:hypothetical protein
MADDLDPVALEAAFLAAADAAAKDESTYLAFLRAYLKALRSAGYVLAVPCRLPLVKATRSAVAEIPGAEQPI